MTTQEINESLKKIITQTSLSQAIRIALTYLKKFYPHFNEERLYQKIRFRSNPSLSFQKSEISSAVLKHNEDGAYIEMTLNFLSIFGSSSPLPSHYSEMVLQDMDNGGSLKDYLDLYNHHLQKFIYPIWEKHRYYVRYSHGLEDEFSKYVTSIMGLFEERIGRKSGLDIHKLLPFLGLLMMKPKSAEMILPILRHYLEHDSVHIVQCVGRNVTIPSEQRSMLGSENMVLGKSILLGESIHSKNTKFQIVLHDVAWSELENYSVYGSKMENLGILIDFLLQDPLEYEVVLNVASDQIRSWKLDSENALYLGINTVLGSRERALDIHFKSKGK